MYPRTMQAALTGRLLVVILILSLVSRSISTPDIGIQQDWFTDSEELNSFSGIIQFNQNDDGSNPVSALSDGQLVGLASKAYDEMTAFGNINTPGAMAVMATNNEIFFASALRGGDRGHWLNPQIDDTRPNILIRAAGGCRLAGNHRLSGRCGEINLFDLYFNWKTNLNLQGTQSRIVIWGTFDNSPLQILNPCRGAGSRYGCDAFLRAATNPQNPTAHLDDANLKVIPKTTAVDQSWPNGLTFTYKQQRPSTSDKAALCEIADTEFDPNQPELRKRAYALPGIRD